MKIRLRHNTKMRFLFGLVSVIGFPGLLFLAFGLLWGWRAGLAAALVAIGFVAYGFFFGWRHIVVRGATCASPLLPEEFDGYRIVQLSDIHIGTFLRNRGFVDKMVRQVNALKPDLVVFTGDLVNVSAEEVIPFQRQLSLISAPDGVFSVMGNHDYCEYGDDKSDRNIVRNQNVLRYLEGKIGWRLLLNSHAAIRRGASAIWLVGVENISRPPFSDYGDLEKAMEGVPEGTFKILLSHDPSHWRRGVLHQTDIALTLSGHTHAGQIRIGRFTPAKWMYHEWGGKYVEGGSMLYVSQGIGGTVPFRLGAWPEVNVIVLRRR